LGKPWISGNIPRALAGYNAGPYAKWLKVGKNPHTQETREYMDVIPKI
jgi:soluble lytic murein transglycosylase-like protein